MTHFSRRQFILLGSAVCLSACAGDVSMVGLAPNSRIIILRHAERDEELLNAAGHARAAALPAAVQAFDIDAIYTPGIERNDQTASPLANALGIEIGTLNLTNIGRNLARAARGRTVVWVGNKGNLASIWEALALEGEPPLEYGELFIVTADSAGVITIDRRHFGI